MFEGKYRIIRVEDGQEVQIPAVVFLATDVFAIVALLKYQKIIHDFHPNHNYVFDCELLIRDFQEWRRKNPRLVKIPD